MAPKDQILDLITTTVKKATRGTSAAGSSTPVRRAPPPRTRTPKPRVTDAEIDAILAEGGITRADLAREYPAIAPPVPSIDARTGKAYLAKGESPEAAAVARARKLIQGEIKRGDYDQLFDVDARYNADPSYYNRPDLTASIVPKRADTTQKYIDLYAGPESAARLDDAISAAIDKPGAHGFYKLGQLQDEFIRVLGPVDGPRMFQERVADSMAATSGGADPTSNLLMSALGNYLKEARINPPMGRNTPPPDFPTAAYEMPYPVGGRFASGNMAMFDKMIGVDSPGAGINADNPKRYDFSSAMLGYTDRPVVDEQMMKAIDPTSSGAPSSNAYGVARQAVADAAQRAGLTPIGGQEVGWAGIKGSEGKPFIQDINEMLYRTSRLTGKSLQEVLEGYIRATMPQYGIGGAAVGGGILALSPEEEEAIRASGGGI